MSAFWLVANGEHIRCKRRVVNISGRTVLSQMRAGIDFNWRKIAGDPVGVVLQMLRMRKLSTRTIFRFVGKCSF